MADPTPAPASCSRCSAAVPDGARHCPACGFDMARRPGTQEPLLAELDRPFNVEGASISADGAVDGFPAPSRPTPGLKRPGASPAGPDPASGPGAEPPLGDVMLGPVAEAPDTTGRPVLADLSTGGLRLDEESLRHIAAAKAARTGPGASPGSPAPAPTGLRRSVFLALLAVVLVGGAVAGWIGFGDRLQRAAEPRPGRGEKVIAPGDPLPEGSGLVIIDSKPQGARVYFDGESMGVTPLATQNPYPEGEAFEIRLELKGYRTLKTRGVGGEAVQLDARLERKRR